MAPRAAASFSLTNVTLVSIAVSPGNPELAEGVVGQFTATGTYADGSTADITGFVTWASATPTVATIGGTGLATALARGNQRDHRLTGGRHQPRRHLDRDGPQLRGQHHRRRLRFLERHHQPARGHRGRNAVPGQTITFDPTVFASAQTITLSLGQLELSNASETEAITGPAAGVTVNAGRASRVFQVDTGVTASISGMTITGGSARQRRRPVQLRGTATLTNCTVSGNTAGHNGGGLYVNNSGATTLTNCTVSGNSAGHNGGGLYVNDSGTTTLTDCTVSGNTASHNGGGLYINNSGTTHTDQLHRQRNSARYYGGGVDNNATTESGQHDHRREHGQARALTSMAVSLPRATT